MKRWLLPLVLWLCLIILGIAWLIAGPSAKPAQLGMGLIESEIQTIRIHQANETITLQREDDSWFLIEPVHTQAIRVEYLLHLLQQEVLQQFPAAGHQLADFGLDAQSTTITFNQQSFRLGTIESLSGGQFVLLNDHIALIAPLPLPSAAWRAGTFISPKLLPESLQIIAIHWLLPSPWHASHWPLALITHLQAAEASSMLPAQIFPEWHAATAHHVRLRLHDDHWESIPAIQLQSAGAAPRAFAVLFEAEELLLIDRNQKLEYRLPRAAYQRLFGVSPDA